MDCGVGVVGVAVGVGGGNCCSVVDIKVGAPICGTVWLPLLLLDAEWW